jgi:hypothetical protein
MRAPNVVMGSESSNWNLFRVCVCAVRRRRLVVIGGVQRVLFCHVPRGGWARGCQRASAVAVTALTYDEFRWYPTQIQDLTDSDGEQQVLTTVVVLNGVLMQSWWSSGDALYGFLEDRAVVH